MINQVARSLCALSVVGLLSVDGYQEEQHVEKPNTISPADWALYNATQARALAALSGLPAPEPGVLELAPYEVDTLEVRVDATAHLRELLGKVRAAASELEGANDAVAADLLGALARFSNQTGVRP